MDRELKITKKIIREYVRTKLASDKVWALRALEVVYNNQTDYEQINETTNEHNEVGFTGADGEILTSIANQYMRWRTLSPKQMEIVMKKMKKYWKQILPLMDTHKLYECMVRDGFLTKEQVFINLL